MYVYVCVCANFQAKRKALTFFSQNFPENRFRVGYSENYKYRNFGMRISILSIPYVAIFIQNGQLWIFSALICSKMDLGLESEKSNKNKNVGIRISIVEILCVLIYSQNGYL